MNGLDWFIVGFLTFGLLLGFVRGILKEMLSLAGWLVALYYADMKADLVLKFLPAVTQTFNLFIAKLAILISILSAAIVIRWLVSVLLSDLKKTQASRLMGSFVGLIKQYLVITVGVMVATFTAVTETDIWKNSALLPQIIPSQAALAGHISPETKQALSSLSTVKVSWQLDAASSVPNEIGPPPPF